MSQKFWTIGYRIPSQLPLYFRGDNRYAIYLPSLRSDGWVKQQEFARLFVRPPDFGPYSISKTLDARFIVIYPYEHPVSPNNVIRPTSRPKRR